MNKIPKNIKYIIYGMYVLIFLILNNSVFGVNPIINLIQLLEKITGYHFGISTNTLDYLIFASFPIFGMLLNSRRDEFKISELIMDIFSILLWTIITLGIGLFLLIYFGWSSNPLIPEYLLTEPFNLYSTIIISIGIGVPFIINKIFKTILNI